MDRKTGKGSGGQDEDVQATTTDPLFQALHAEHEDVAGLLERVLAERPSSKLIDLWHELSVKLATHTRAEQETVYERLAEDDDLAAKVEAATVEHDEVERMLAEADAQGPGTAAFFALVTDIQAAVLHHVREEEEDILPEVRLGQNERQKLVNAFRARSRQVQLEVERELKPIHDEARQELQAGLLDETDEDEASDGDLDDKTLEELKSLAKARGIEGRSKMSRDQLLTALRKA